MFRVDLTLARQVYMAMVTRMSTRTLSICSTKEYVRSIAYTPEFVTDNDEVRGKAVISLAYALMQA